MPSKILLRKWGGGNFPMRDIRFINFARGLTSRAESNGGRSGGCFARPKQWVSGFFEPFTFDALGLLSNLPRSWSRAPGADRKIDAPDVEVQACQRYSVPGLYCIELERHLRCGGRSGGCFVRPKQWDRSGAWFAPRKQ